MNLEETMVALEKLGTEQTRKIYANHGCEADMFGVSVANLKNILKVTKKDHDLALKLFKTGNADAQYLAGLMADSKKFSEVELQEWAENASWQMVAEYSVPWNVAESQHGLKLSETWINSKNDNLNSIGWSSLAALISYEKHAAIEPEKIMKFLSKIEKEIQSSSNRTKYTMNAFIIALGASEPDYFESCQEIANRIGKVNVFMGKTACKVPDAFTYLEKIKQKGRIGMKRKSIKC